MSIFSICKNLRKVTDAELVELEADAIAQRDYTHPLKMATASKQQALGAYNIAVLTKLRELRDLMNRGPEGDQQ